MLVAANHIVCPIAVTVCAMCVIPIIQTGGNNLKSEGRIMDQGSSTATKDIFKYLEGASDISYG